MDAAPKTRLEWMRLEFQDARRRRLVKTSAQMATSRASSVAEPPVPAVVGDPVATNRRDHPTTR